MKKITLNNAVKFTKHVTKKLKKVNCLVDNFSRFEHKRFIGTIDIEESTVYSVFIKFKKNYPSFVNNQFSGKHNFHFSGSLKNAIEQFNIYFLDIEDLNNVNITIEDKKAICPYCKKELFKGDKIAIIENEIYHKNCLPENLNKA